MAGKRFGIIAASVMIMAMALSGCGGTMTTAERIDGIPSGSENPSVEELPVSEIAEGKELLCLCDSQEEAQKIADMYGIELVEYSYGVATFHTDDPQGVIEMGKEKGYPELEINGISYINDLSNQ